MANSTESPSNKSDWPPDPRHIGAFRDWLVLQPREWSVVLAARAALRVLPLVRPFVRGDDGSSAVFLALFRATAIARVAASYPTRALASSVAAASASSAASASRASRATSAPSPAAASSSAAYASASVYADASAAAAAAAASFSAASSASADAITAESKLDAQHLHNRTIMPRILAAAPLWSSLPPSPIGGAWIGLAQELRRLGHHWSVWIDWYDDVLAGAAATEDENLAFTDVPGELPWRNGAEAVNTEIARRLAELRTPRTAVIQMPAREREEASKSEKSRTIDRLAEVASPQPSITEKGQLDAGPNRPFDIPTVDDDLSTLPMRQRNLIKGILGDLPANAPRHLKRFLKAYDNELKVRGAQPILGLLKDSADIIAAAVSAPRAEDEWLEPGIRKAFDRFRENHTVFVEHFPLDAEREAIYAGTALDEDAATGQKLVEPFELIAKATQEAHKAGAATDDFLAVIDRMTEFARVLATQPPTLAPDNQRPARHGEIKISPEDRLQPVTTKKRVILGALGFLNGTYAIIGTTVTIVTASYAGVLEALKPAIEMLSRFLR